MSNLDTFDGYAEWLKTTDPFIASVHDKRDGTCLIVKRLIFHWTLLRATVGDEVGYDDRWCYTTREEATAAAEQWIELGSLMPNDEPMGWHRHHRTGRRRTNGDPSLEYISH